MKKIILISIFYFNGCSLHSVYIKDGYQAALSVVPNDSIANSVFLIGDAGAPVQNGEETILKVLAGDASVNHERNTIVFLGDNIYPAGLPDFNNEDRKEMERRLNEQIAAGEKSGAQTVFIPGNHDWERQGKEGRETLKRQEDFIKGKERSNISMLPSGGYPGPAIIDINKDIRIIIIDTQWWLHEYEKPLFDHAPTEVETKRIFLDSLSAVLSSGRKTIVVAHHPLESHGEHGGFFDWRDHLFPLRHVSTYAWIPLPVIGSLYPLSRMWGISNQDFAGSKYNEMRIALDSVISRKPPIAYVSGHEHTLQVLEPKNGYYHVVSGFGMKSHFSPLTSGDNTLFARLAPGFMRMDFMTNGSVQLRVFEVGDNVDDTKEIFTIRLR